MIIPSHTLRRKSYVVIGDIMVDEYILGRVSRISPEAPVPVLMYESRRRAPGGAANVAMNLVGLGNSVELVGMIGKDEAGQWLKDFLYDQNVGTKGVISCESRPTIVKARYATVQQAILRVDYEDTRSSEASHVIEMTAYVEQHLQKNHVDGVLVSDYNKGLIGCQENNLFQHLFNKLVNTSIMCAVDTKKNNSSLRLFEGFSFIKPNLSELLSAVNVNLRMPSDLPLACKKYLDMCKADKVLVTMGTEGLFLFDGIGEIHVPTIPASVYDVTGAGDTVFAVIMHSLVNDLSWNDSMRLANIAASLVIEFRGTKAVTISELNRRMQFIERTRPDYFMSSPSTDNSAEKT